MPSWLSNAFGKSERNASSNLIPQGAGSPAVKLLVRNKAEESKERHKRRVQELTQRLTHSQSAVENLSWWNLSSEEVAQVITLALRCSSLTTLYLDGNHLGSSFSGISTVLLSPSCHLTELTLTENSIGPGALKAIGNALRVNTTLLLLDLRNNNVAANGTDFDALKTLTDCLAGEYGTPGINYNRTLRSLDLSGNTLLDFGVMTIQPVLLKSPVISEFHLAHNNITSEGARLLLSALKGGYEVGARVCRMQLQGNDITPRELLKINEVLNKSVSKRRSWEANVQSRCKHGGARGPKMIISNNQIHGRGQTAIDERTEPLKRSEVKSMSDQSHTLTRTNALGSSGDVLCCTPPFSACLVFQIAKDVCRVDSPRDHYRAPRRAKSAPLGLFGLEGIFAFYDVSFQNHTVVRDVIRDGGGQRVRIYWLRSREEKLWRMAGAAAEIGDHVPQNASMIVKAGVQTAFRGDSENLKLDPAALFERLPDSAKSGLGIEDAEAWCKYVVRSEYYIKYEEITRFVPHLDKPFVRNASEISLFTINQFFNQHEPVEEPSNILLGGATRFFGDFDAENEAALRKRADQDADDATILSLKPETGTASFFRQTPGARILHDGEEVVSGVKYLLRTDVMYKALFDLD
ncbi:hypothetical protein CYMTET_43887 [Cymbomonas tetramitiformis]|uniref:Uncharacterized protein n=1 Tax=Cymbomonas tetramitiformis TaxID=36881 RepID=A0AAE0C2J1_9CHLO|nr:hypothetical protein CYMTET_43891 [Cymbomonas tetramitiformis]KAK3246578.1 hypothetical protein CYMTET_43887 [Cymbomonas tetramitiformis]